MRRIQGIAALLLFLGAAGLGAVDFGLTINQFPELSGTSNGDSDIVYSAGLAPWFSAALGESVDLYFSGSFAMKYKNEEWKPVPNIGRFSVQYRLRPGLFLEAGRMRYEDPNAMIARGLFDGLYGSMDLKDTRLSAGVWFTGLLYRDTANIFMNAADYSHEYFAGRRIVSAVNWDIPALFGSAHSFSLNGLAQFDVNADDDGRLHSQYLSTRFLFSPLPSIDIDLGAVMGLAEIAGEDPYINSALFISVNWSLPSRIQDRISLGFRWSSGREGKSIGPFTPLTTVSQSSVLDCGLPGLMLANAAYTARLHNAISLNLDARYLFRTDPETFADLELDHNGGKALGGECFASIVWVPVMDLALSAGGGVFIPETGNAFITDAPLRWKMALGLILSL